MLFMIRLTLAMGVMPTSAEAKPAPVSRDAPAITNARLLRCATPITNNHARMHDSGSDQKGLARCPTPIIGGACSDAFRLSLRVRRRRSSMLDAFLRLGRHDSARIREDPSAFAFPSRPTPRMALAVGWSGAHLRILGVAHGVAVEMKRFFPAMWTGLWLNVVSESCC